MSIRRLSTGLTFIAAAAFAFGAQAAPIASETFSYAANSALQGSNQGTGWNGAWVASNNLTIGSVSSPTDDPMSGTALRVGPGSPVTAEGSASRSLAGPVTARSVLVEFVFQFDGGALQTNDFLALWLGNANAANMGLKVNCGDGTCAPGTSASADLFVRTETVPGFGNADNQKVAYTTNINIGQSYTLMGLLEMTGSSMVYDTFSLWIDPSAAERQSLTGADAIAVGASTLSSFSQIGFRSVNIDAGDRLLVDNLTISNVPEPGTLALVGATLLSLGFKRRRST